MKSRPLSLRNVYSVILAIDLCIHRIQVSTVNVSAFIYNTVYKDDSPFIRLQCSIHKAAIFFVCLEGYDTFQCKIDMILCFTDV